MLVRGRWLLIAQWVPPPRLDTAVTVPPPPAVEAGGLPGTAVAYSPRVAETPHWKRMAHSTYATRMDEMQSHYPMSKLRPGDYDVRWLPKPWPDFTWGPRKPLHEVGEPNNIPSVEVPVIFLATVVNEADNTVIGRLHETRYVNGGFMRQELHPQRLAVYATPDNYRLLGLPERDHRIHASVPKSRKEYEKLRKRWLWDNEPWRFTVDFLFRKYEAGPPELRDDPTWDGDEGLVQSEGGAGASTGTGRKGSGPVVNRKAKKVKLF